jgi:hypothetical protein
MRRKGKGACHRIQVWKYSKRDWLKNQRAKRGKIRGEAGLGIVLKIKDDEAPEPEKSQPTIEKNEVQESDADISINLGLDKPEKKKEVKNTKEQKQHQALIISLTDKVKKKK